MGLILPKQKRRIYLYFFLLVFFLVALVLQFPKLSLGKDEVLLKAPDFSIAHPCSINDQVFVNQDKVYPISCPNIAKDLSAYLYQPPPYQKSSKDLDLRLVSSGDRFCCNFHEKIYLNRDDQMRLIFSSKPTELFITPIEMRGSHVVFTGRLLHDGFEIDMSAFDVSLFSVSVKEPEVVRFDQLAASALHSFKAAKFWNKNLLTGAFTLSFKGDLISFTHEDVLTFQEGKWQKSILSKTLQGVPIIKVKKIDREIAFDAWDEKGDYYLVKTDFEPITPPSDQIGKALSNIKMKTLNQISFLLNEKKQSLKVGGQIALVQNKWRVIETKEDREWLKQHLDEAEVFLFDGIERKINQKALLGRVFSPHYTACKDVILPLKKTQALTKTFNTPKSKTLRNNLKTMRGRHP